MPKIHEKTGGLGGQPAKPSGGSVVITPEGILEQAPGGQPAKPRGGSGFGVQPPQLGFGSADAHVLIDLLKEYTEKFHRWSINAETAKLRRLMPLGTELASRASQQIEYGGLDDLTRFELKLRLEEFEVVLLGAKGITPKSA